MSDNVVDVIVEEQTASSDLALYVSEEIAAVREDAKKLKEELETQANSINSLNADIVTLNRKIEAYLENETPVPSALNLMSSLR